jgi:DNA-binding PadR family transcriptional regulator
VSDGELERWQAKKWEELNFTPRDATPEFEQAILSDQEAREIPDDPEGKIEVAEDADRLLKDIVENPFKSLTERYDEFPSSYKGNKTKNDLVDHGLVVERNVRVGEQRKLLQLTEKGRDYAESLGLEVKHAGRGGVVHQYWQHRIRDAFEEAGWDAFLEKFDADVYVNMGSTELVVEVAMGDNPREIDHVEDHLERGFIVWIACRNNEIRDGLKQRLEENGLNPDSVVFRLFRQFNKLEFDAG